MVAKSAGGSRRDADIKTPKSEEGGSFRLPPSQVAFTVIETYFAGAAFAEIAAAYPGAMGRKRRGAAHGGPSDT